MPRGPKLMGGGKLFFNAANVFRFRLRRKGLGGLLEY